MSLCAVSMYVFPGLCVWCECGPAKLCVCVHVYICMCVKNMHARFSVPEVSGGCLWTGVHETNSLSAFLDV